MSIESENLLKKFRILEHSEKGILEEIMRDPWTNVDKQEIETVYLATF